MDQIEKEFQKKALVRGGIYLFHPEDAVKVIERCRILNKRILGIDSFRITDKETRPVDSIDFSIDGSSEGFWQEAIEFIRLRRNEGLMFEIVHE